MIPRPWAIALLLLALAIPCVLADNPPPIADGGVTGLDLKTQLEKGLRARRPVEFEYIDEIVKLVAKGDLPRSLVASTFGWARRQPTRQLQYFQFALQARARNLDVALPNLRHQAVGIGTNGGFDGVGNFGHDPLPPGP
jgi:hypothetical protein